MRDSRKHSEQGCRNDDFIAIKIMLADYVVAQLHYLPANLY